MKYNLNPFFDLMDESVPSHDIWKERFRKFFFSPNVKEEHKDLYYNILINNYNSLRPLLNEGYLIDEYSGIFTFNVPQMRGIHSFNMANFIRRNHMFFYKKSIKTMTMDFGIVNIQLQQCGLKLDNVIMPIYSIPGAALLVIGNDCMPYDFKNDNDYDVLIACNVFNTEDQAWENWNALFDAHLSGKKVFFTSPSFVELRKFVNYDRIKQVENPVEIYDPETYANGDLGYMNKIYQIV